ncbi:hypothetical protein [Novosphingobium sp. Gsoil 351]|uniref:hypothetical protein n=1 Tax=Novosphingobium sp. Gsoil 351 TaxID=2675225 RepID=UPI001E646B17|nr:hypothetical protein [Novosphingobium sp. Gsoil 351]
MLAESPVRRCRLFGSAKMAEQQSLLFPSAPASLPGRIPLRPVHNFRTSLALSNSYSDAPWWLDLYRIAFPTLVSAVSVREDGLAQRGGIDRVLTLACGRTYTVDEKVRTNEWPDILLEQWSDEARRSPGWVQKPLACDSIAYAFAPSRRCYLLPVAPLHRAWRMRRNGSARSGSGAHKTRGGSALMCVYRYQC